MTYRDRLVEMLAEREAEIANPVGLTPEARAHLEQERDAITAMLQREEGFNVVD